MFCSQPGEVIRFQEMAKADGYTNVKSVYNGYQEFINEGYPMEENDDFEIWVIGAVIFVILFKPFIGLIVIAIFASFCFLD